MKAGLVALIGAAWIGCGPFLAWFMGKRGYEAFSWLVVGSLMGPAALAIAVTERVPWTQPPSELVIRGKNAGGAVNVLVLMDDADVVPDAWPLDRFAPNLGRLTIARIVLEGGPAEDKALATRLIEEAVERIEPYTAEGMLLFGLTSSAVAATLREGRFHVVVTARPNAAVREAIAGTDVIYVEGSPLEAVAA